MPFPSSSVFANLTQDAAAVADPSALRPILRRVADAARQATGARYGALGVLGEHGTLSDFIHVGMSEELADRIGKLPIGKGVLGTLIRTPEPITVPDISAHGDFSGFPANHPPMKSFLGVPVRAGDQVFGNLYLTEKDEGSFSDEDMATAQAMAAIAGGAVSSSRLHQRLALVAVIEDRERIARDLHDAVIQDLFATGLSLQALTMGQAEGAVADRIRDSVDRIDESIDALRNFIFDLRRVKGDPPAPAQTMERTIRRLCIGGETLELDLKELDGLPSHTIDTITGVVREAVSNACRHGGCSLIAVSTWRTTGSLELTIRDDGVGFEHDPGSTGMGLTNMRTRVGSASGSLSIETAPGQGTLVRASIPC